MFLKTNKPTSDFSEYPRLANELNPRDVVFRMDFDDKKRQEMPPFTSEQCPYNEKHLQIWAKLFEGKITEEEALEEITLLMEEYYGKKYSLYRGFNR